MGFLKKYFIRGFLITVPIAATFVIFRAMVLSLEGLLGGLLKKHIHYYLPGFGIVVLVSFIFLVGIFGGNIIGRKFILIWEAILKKLPIINKIYSIIKSVVETISSSSQKKFNRVYIVEFPRKEMYCLAFVTSETSLDIPLLNDKDLVHVFIPTAPNPTSGYFIMLPKKDLIDIQITAEDGMKMILSGGFFTPNPIPSPAGAVAEPAT